MSASPPPAPATSELEVSEVKAGGEMCREGRRRPGETQSTSREHSSSQLNSPCQETQNNTCYCSSWYWSSHLFISTFFLPLSPTAPGWYLQVSCHWLARTAHLEHCPQTGSLDKMEVLSSIVVRLSEARYKPGMLEMSMGQERRKYSSVMKA